MNRMNDKIQVIKAAMWMSWVRWWEWGDYEEPSDWWEQVEADESGGRSYVTKRSLVTKESKVNEPSDEGEVSG